VNERRGVAITNHRVFPDRGIRTRALGIEPGPELALNGRPPMTIQVIGGRGSKFVVPLSYAAPFTTRLSLRAASYRSATSFQFQTFHTASKNFAFSLTYCR